MTRLCANSGTWASGIAGKRIVSPTLFAFSSEVAGDIKKLSGRDHEWRLRVGDWRVIN